MPSIAVTATDYESCGYDGSNKRPEQELEQPLEQGLRQALEPDAFKSKDPRVISTYRRTTCRRRSVSRKPHEDSGSICGGSLWIKWLLTLKSQRLAALLTGFQPFFSEQIVCQAMWECRGSRMLRIRSFRLWIRFRAGNSWRECAENVQENWQIHEAHNVWLAIAGDRSHCLLHCLIADGGTDGEKWNSQRQIATNFATFCDWDRKSSKLSTGEDWLAVW